MRKPTNYEIKKRTAKTAPYFFTRDTLEYFGQTLRDFSVVRENDGRFKIEAKSYFMGDYMGETVRFFNPETNELESS